PSRSSQPLYAPGPFVSSTLQEASSAGVGVLIDTVSCFGRNASMSWGVGCAAWAVATPPHAIRQPAASRTTRRFFDIPVSFIALALDPYRQFLRHRNPVRLTHSPT